VADYPWIKSYPPGVTWELDVPRKTLHQSFDESCALYADLPMTDFLDKVMTYKDYKEATDRAAAGFQKLGVKPGVHVGLYLPNTPHYLIAFFGVLKAGGCIVNYSPLDADRELEFKIGDETVTVNDLFVVRPGEFSSSRIFQFIETFGPAAAVFLGAHRVSLFRAGILVQAAKSGAASKLQPATP